MEKWVKFVGIVYLSCILSIECKKIRKNNCDIRKFEDSIHTIFLTYEKSKWPENEDEMDVWCESVPKSHRFLKNYADNCLQGLSRPTVSVLNYNAQKANKMFCKNKQERKRFIDQGVCKNKGKDDGLKCWNKVISTVEVVKNITDAKEKLSSLCCVFYFLNECVIDVFKRLYPRYCSEDNLQHIEHHIDKVAMDSFSLLCSEYEDRDKCANYKFKLDKKAKSNVPLRYKTPFPTTFEILATL